MAKIKVIMAGAELAPLVKVGGLGDVMGALPPALSKLGVDIKIFIPCYGSINRRKYKIRLVRKNIGLDVGQRLHKFDLYQTTLPGSRVKVFLIRHRMFAGSKIYLGGRRYFRHGSYSREHTDIERFTFFSKAVVEVIRTMKWQPDIVHAHDWHTALLPTFIDEYSLQYSDFRNIKTLYTIHNLANQGIAPLDIVDYAALDHDLTPALMEDYYDDDGKKIDAMKVGILSADYINTVSPTYAKEILSKEYGAGLESYLKRRQKHLFGILNGIDIDLFNPARDRFISKRYSLKNLAVFKPANKESLQKFLKLPVADQPLIGLVSRLVSQKGLDILLPVLERLLKKYDFQIVVLGTGQKEFENSLRALAKKYPDKVSTNITFSLSLAQKIYAGADFFLMPSQFEPCGLGQMIAMRYGTVPIVRQTGGLKDTVVHNKTGLVFKKYRQADLSQAITKALRLYQNKAKIKKIKTAGMRQDFSWDASARQYLKLYKKLK